MANMLFMDVGLAHVDYDEKDAAFWDDKEGMSESIYEEADFLCLPRYWDIVEWLDHVPPRKMTVDRRYIGVPVNYHAEKSRHKMARDRQILYEIIGECTLIKGLKNHPFFQLPGEDEFTIGVVKMLATRSIPIWLVLASQIQCDIRYILEENVTYCHQQLQEMGDRVQQILGNYMGFVEQFDVCNFSEHFVFLSGYIWEFSCVFKCLGSSETLENISRTLKSFSIKQC
jgi:hypothetical protein